MSDNDGNDDIISRNRGGNESNGTHDDDGDNG